MTQVEVADGVGRYLDGDPVRQATVSAWMRGVAPRTLRLGRAVSRYYQVCAGWLYFGEGETVELTAVANYDA